MSSKDRWVNHLIKSRPVANAGIYLAGPEDHKTPAYKRGMRQLAAWHKQCAERRAKAACESGAGSGESGKERRGEMRRNKLWLVFEIVFAVLNAYYAIVPNDTIIRLCNAVVAIVLSYQAVGDWRALKRGGKAK